MKEQGKIHVLLLGLDHRLLWQLTRTLAHLEDRMEIDCVKEPSAAKEICDREQVDVIVVDGWDQAWNAARYLSGDEIFEGGGWKWIIFAESLPLECLPAGRPSPSAVFLEKPFNPKEFPPFLLDLVEQGEVSGEREPEVPVPESVSLPLTPGESYQAPGGVSPEQEEPGERGGEPAVPEGEQVEPPAQPPPPERDPFHSHVDQGFACLGEKDWKGAWEHWSEALKIRPNDTRLQSNLRRLEKRMKEGRGLAL